MGFKSKSLVWLDRLEDLKKHLQAKPNSKTPEIQKALKLEKSQVYEFLKLNDCFDLPAIQKVRSAMPYFMSFRNALALAGLNGKVGDLPGAFHPALDLVLTRELTTIQIEYLVEWIVSGKPVGEFDPMATPTKRTPGPKVKRQSTALREPQGPESIERVGSPQSTANRENHTPPLSGGEPPQSAEEVTFTPTDTPALPARSWGQRVGAAIDTLLVGSPSIPKPSQHPKAAKKHPELKAVVKDTVKNGKWVARIFWHWSLKHLHYVFKWVANQVVPLHQSHASGHKHRGASSGLTNPVPVVLHWGVYSLCQLVFWWVVLGGLAARFSPVLKPWVEYPFRFLAYLVAVDFPAWVWRLAQEHLGLAIFLGVVLALSLFGAFAKQPLRTGLLVLLLGAVWFYGRGWGTEKLPTAGDSTTTAFNRHDATIAKKDETIGNGTTTTLAEPPMHRDAKATSTNPKDSKPLHLSTFKPVTKVVSSPSPKAVPWNSDIEDRSYLEAEMEAIPLPARIKMVTFQVDIMSADMSVKRLGDLQDPEKYSLIVGHDKQKVLSVSPAMTGFTLTYGGGLPIEGILGGPGKIEFYWEDVKAIHCDEIKTKAKQLYQLGLVVNGMKRPFLVQCATPEALRHLLSAFEFWIGAATHAHPPISGMPYLSQGLRLDNSGKVAALWADSPADLAALQFGDGIWSLDSDSNQPQGKNYIEGALDSLTPGKHYLYVVTPEDWKGGPLPSNLRMARPFNPKRQRMELLVP